MTVQSLKELLPDSAKDIRLNLESVLTVQGAPGLEDRQVKAIALASAIASRNTRVLDALQALAESVLSEDEIRGVQTAAALMSMTNVYYRFTHLVSDPEYANMRAGLRMNQMANPGIDRISFELCSLAVSAINGCGMCIDSHEKVLRQHEVTAQAVQSAVRIASVVHAVSVMICEPVLEAEAA